MSIIRSFIMATALLTLLPGVSLGQSSDLTLLMVEEDGCVYCARWHADIAPEYPKTPEGQAAPLQQVDIGDQPYDGITLRSRAVFTPTFILLNDGVEVGRLEGYMGEDFFWGLLQRMIDNSNPKIEAEG